MDGVLFSFVSASKTRVILVKVFEGSMSVKQLSEGTAISLNLTSRALKELEAEGVIICLNPKKQKGRLYELTSSGLEIQAELRKF